VDNRSPVIPANKNESDTLIVVISDDQVAHCCNKLIPNVYSLAPGLYRAMPYTRGQGFDYVVYLDNDGANEPYPKGRSDVEKDAREERYEKLKMDCG